MKSLIYKNGYLPTYDIKDEFLTPFDKIFDDIMNFSFPSFTKDFGVDFFEKGSYPKCDVIDYADKVRLELEIPGVDKNDISIEMKSTNEGKQHLIISGKKSSEYNEENEGKYIRRELKRSAFKRSFLLNDSLKYDSINAEFKNGVLKIDIPKKEPKEVKEDVKKIEIK